MCTNNYAISADSYTVKHETSQMPVYAVHNNLIIFAIVVSLRLLQDYEEQILNKNKTRNSITSRKLL